MFPGQLPSPHPRGQSLCKDLPTFPQVLLSHLIFDKWSAQSASRFTSSLIHSTHSGISLLSGSAQRSPAGHQVSSCPLGFPAPTFSPHLPLSPPEPCTWPPNLAACAASTCHLGALPVATNSSCKAGLSPKNDGKEKAHLAMSHGSYVGETHTHPR